MRTFHRHARSALGIRRRLHGALLVALGFLLALLNACGAPPPGGGPPIGGGPQPDPQPIDGLAFFWAATPDHGFEPWVSDGTAAGTRMITDLRPGPEGSIALTPFFVHDGFAYFAANDGVHGDELWRTDGTEAGTALVADIRPGSGGSEITAFRRVGNTLLFLATDDGIALHTWTAGGEVDGAVRLTTTEHIAFDPQAVQVAGTWYARGIDGLVQSAGLPTSETTPVADTQGVTPCGSNAIIGFNGWVYYAGNDGVHGCELWRWGSMAGNQLFRDIAGLSTAAGPSDFAVRGSRMYFRAAAEGCSTSTQCQDRRMYVTLGELPPLDPALEDTTTTAVITNSAGEPLSGNVRWHPAPWGDLFFTGGIGGYSGWPLARVDGISSIESFTVLDADPTIEHQSIRFFDNRLLYRSSVGFMSTGGGTPATLLPIGDGYVHVVLVETATHLYLGVEEWHGNEARFTVWRTNGANSSGTTRVAEICRYDFDTDSGTCPEGMDVFPTWL